MHLRSALKDYRPLLKRAVPLTALFIIILIFVFVSVSGTDDDGTKETDEQFEIVLENAIGSENDLKEAERRDAFENDFALFERPAVADAGGYINIRSKPSASDMTNIIGMLGPKAVCEVLREDGEWTYIRSGALEGYVRNEHLVTGEDAETLAWEDYNEKVIITTDVLNVRSSPEVSGSNVIEKARKGERYRLIGSDGDWAQIKLDSSAGAENGWVSTADGNAEIRCCMNLGRRYDLREMVLTQYDELVVSDTSDYVNIRKTPVEDGINNIVGKFGKGCGGELLETVQSNGATWYKIKSGNVTGYVRSDYCRTGFDARDIAVDNAYLQAYVRVKNLNVRSAPSMDAKVWTSVTSGQEYQVLDILDEWVRIELGSSDGEDEDMAFIYTGDNYVEVRFGLGDAAEYYPLIEARNKAAAFRNSIVNYACRFVGNKYVWGGTSLTNGCDCSGFTQSVFAHFGIRLPRVSADQSKSGERIKSDTMKPGDLVFYANSQGVVNHVGIYIGNGQVVNAASKRSGIRIYKWNYRTPVAIRNVIGP